MTIADSCSMMENGASCLPCTPEEEKRIVMEFTKEAESNLKEGNLYYVVSNRWFAAWQKYTGQDSGDYLIGKHSTNSKDLNDVPFEAAARPGQIDNLDLVLNGSGCEGDDDKDLVRNLEEGRDYVFVAHKVWEKLIDWYKGGPALPRKLISQGDEHHKNFRVEVYPLCLKLTDSRDNSQSVIRLSTKASIHELYEKVCTAKGISQEQVRIWDYFNKRKESILEVPNKTLAEYNLQMDQDILLEMDGSWSSRFSKDSTGNELALVPIEPSRSSVTIAGGPTLSNGYSTCYDSTPPYQGGNLSSAFTEMEDGYDILSTVTKEEKGGLAGLQNLGNTCFMNSAIQCLVHTPPLVEYFLQDYTEEINKRNPLGMQGELALAFGELLRKLWSSGRTSIAPRAFKGKLARFAPQFSGYNQHDSQELLAFLLDGLHEDLNRVKQKPYIETKDAHGRPDEEVADEFWNNHKARNDSVIVDICQGQYKSTLVCPVCEKISITFDPFMYLSLPLPSTATRTMAVTVFYADGSGLPMPFTVTVLKQGCWKDLAQALSTECCLKPDESILLAEVYEHKIYRFLETPSEPLSSIKDDEIIVGYRIPKKRAGSTKLEIIHRSQEKCTSDKSPEMKIVGTPLVTYLDGPQTASDIDIAINKLLFPLKRKTYFPSTKVHSVIENGSVSEPIDEAANQSDSPNDPMDETELEAISGGDLIFQITVSEGDEKCFNPLEKDSHIKFGQSLRVILDWTNKEHEIYDASFLNDLPVVCKNGFTVKKTRQEAISLFSCMEAFLKEEPLGPDDMWYCPSCKEHRQATKKLDLWRLPDVIVFHLKRFSYSRYLKNKLDTFVNFPIHNLDLSKYVKSKDASPQSHVYELFAVSNHYGGLGGGHYSAYAKLLDENTWYHFDDSHVSSVGESEVKTSAAYVLFYQRVKGKGVGEPSRTHMSS